MGQRLSLPPPLTPEEKALLPAAQAARRTFLRRCRVRPAQIEQPILLTEARVWVDVVRAVLALHPPQEQL